MNDETRAFVAAHRMENVRDLALHAKRGDAVNLPLALDQIAGWQTARTKLPDWAACDGVVYPPHLSMEQCSSQSTARYKAGVAKRIVGSDAAANGLLVDLTGGFGVDFSYMARVFGHATYVERQPVLCELAEHNMAALGVAHARIVNDEAEHFLQGMDQATLVFLDPARRDAHGARTYAIADCTPDVLALADALLAKAPHVMVKLSPMLDWHKTVADFAGAVHEVHIVSTGNECKELLLVLGRGRYASPLVVCANDEQVLSYKAGDNSDNHTTISDSALAARNTCNTEDSLSEESANDFDSSHWKYLYEPNASIMKAGCFDVLEQRFAVHHISPNSHLFVAAEPIADFPGRSFAIESIATMNKKELKQLLAGLTHANIAVRNFPLTVAQLRKKLKLKDGGSTYLFATTDAQGRHLVLRTKKRKSGSL